MKLVACILSLAVLAALKPVDVRPVVQTAAVTDDADDPAIWVHPSDPARSLILGTNKVKAPSGALVAFGLDGKIRRTIGNLDRPNNVDVEYGLLLGGRAVDIAVLTERLQHRLRIFVVAPDDVIRDVSGDTAVLADRAGEGTEPMGIALYRRPRDGAIFAIVSPKTGPRQNYLQQYRLEEDGSGRVRAVYVRSFGSYSGKKEIEAVAVDDALGYVYYADEGSGIRKYHADPDHPDAARELAHFGESGFAADHEGIAIYAVDDRTGYLVCTDQIDRNSEYHVYRREGTPGNAHDHSELLKIFRGGADATDGIEITSAALGPRFPNGMMVAMNSGPKNFLLYRWEDIAAAGTPALKLARGEVPR